MNTDTRGVAQAAILSPAVLERLSNILPAREPELCDPPAEAGAPARALRVCEPLLDGNELAYVTQCINDNWISSGGPFVGRFEEAFANHVGCSHAIACSSGTAALHLIFAALGLGEGDEVIMPTFTMIATANAVAYTGARPVFVDADPATWNIDTARIAAAITPRTKAIAVVHTYGRPADMDPILELARKHSLRVIEDAAEAHGAYYHGHPAGSLGDVAAFSFYANKIVTTGEGGMVTTNDAALAKIARTLRDHAFSPERHFWHSFRGFNYRMTNLQAAIGLAQTERLDRLVQQRRRLRDAYEARLKHVPGLMLPREDPDTTNAFWMYCFLVEDEFGCSRDLLRESLASRGIETRTTFIPMHLQPIYFSEDAVVTFPIAENLCRRGIYVPSGPALSEADIDYVVREIVRAQSER